MREDDAMAVDVRIQARVVKVYRAGSSRRLGGSPFIGSFPVGDVVPDEITEKLTQADASKVHDKSDHAAAELAPAVLNEVKSGLMFLSRHSASLTGDQMNEILSAFSIFHRRCGIATSSLFDEPKSAADAPAGVQYDLDEDDVFAIPTIQKTVPAAPAASDDVYSILSDGRLLAKPVAVQTTEDNLPLPSARFRSMVSDRYPNVDVSGLVDDWHADLKSAAARMPKPIQSAADESFFFHVPAIIRRRLRAELPALNDRDAFDREAEGIAWEHSLSVDGNKLWHYAVALESVSVEFIWQPRSGIFAEDLKAWLETPYKRMNDAVAE